MYYPFSPGKKACRISQILPPSSPGLCLPGEKMPWNLCGVLWSLWPRSSHPAAGTANLGTWCSPQSSPQEPRPGRGCSADDSAPPLCSLGVHLSEDKHTFDGTSRTFLNRGHWLERMLVLKVRKGLSWANWDIWSPCTCVSTIHSTGPWLSIHPQPFLAYMSHLPIRRHPSQEHRGPLPGPGSDSTC